jgi:hypothetical protein
VGEDGDGEGKDGSETVRTESTHLGERLLDRGEGGRTPRKPTYRGLVEHDDGKPPRADDRVGDLREGSELVARDDEGTRLHLKDDPGKREASNAAWASWEATHAADFPSIEGGVQDRALVGAKDERPWVTAWRKGFEHKGSGVGHSRCGPLGLGELADDACEAGTAASSNAIRWDLERSAECFLEERFRVGASKFCKPGETARIVEGLRKGLCQTFGVTLPQFPFQRSERETLGEIYILFER